MTTVYIVWTDYEACEIFATREDAENFCYNTYGPDQTQWQDIEERTLQPIERKRATEYVAIAWWPDWTYKEAPTEPNVITAYGEQPYVDEDKKATKFRATAATEHAAEQAATALAMAIIPAYEYAQSSHTSSGVLAIYRRADFRGRVGSF